MFELSIALKYMIPRWRQLSVSLISLISTLVIALVVWLIVVFFSVKDGLESGWIDKIIALTAPVRLTPTEQYYNSYYYLSDSISSKSDYTLKSIADKLSAKVSDPLDPQTDEEVPSDWPLPDRVSSGMLKDPVKLAFSVQSQIKSVSNARFTDYETAIVSFLLKNRHAPSQHLENQYNEYTLILGSVDTAAPSMTKALITPNAQDFDRMMISTKNLVSPTANGSGIVFPPPNQLLGDPILLPRGFKDRGTQLGDRGYISYNSPTVSSVQEQRLPVYIAGFYDPGIIPIGGKLILGSHELVSLVRSASSQDRMANSNGINVQLGSLQDVDKVKHEIEEYLADLGIAPYWKVQTYQEYEFTRDIVQQLQSEKNLFSLISLVIIIVACSNIISMLIILVNDKKVEIGILRSMGASSFSIASIFGLCGIVMGVVGSLVGVSAAMLTLKYVNELVGFISRIQGHELFNPVFYGDSLPSTLSTEALTFVVMTTAGISLLAGLVPAIKACLMRPSSVLRSE